MLPAQVLDLQTHIGRLQDRYDLGFGKSRLLHQNLLAEILPESSTAYLSGIRESLRDGAATKLLWLALRNITADWGRAARDWKEAMNQFAILYEDRFIRSIG